ncbi:MAG: hypothetical protein FJW40_02940 [Acidobacteria bacterium]|nr:hypothetical protein [Acidobacteriota bacterium]
MRLLSKLTITAIAAGAYAPLAAQTQVDLRTQSKSADFAAFAISRPNRTGTGLPATCQTGETYWQNDAPAGRNLLGCVATNTWRTLSLPTSNLAATTGQALVWNSVSGQWEPTTIAPAPNYSQTFSAATTVTILGTAHLLGTANLIVDCYNNSTPSQRVEPNTMTVHSTTFDVVITFTVAQTGRCVVNGTGSQPGVLTSVFGRTGVVTAQAGDYSFAQLSGQADATQVGSGTVNNTEFGYLANVTSDVQTQLNGKSATSHSHNTGGDLSGDVGNVTVNRLRNRTVATTAPTDGQTLVWSQTNNQWQPGGVVSLPSMTGNTDRILSNNGAAADWRPLGGDISGAPHAVAVNAIKGRPVAGTTPTNGQALVWNSTLSQWEPQNQASSANTNATLIHNRNIASTTPTDGQVLTWNAATTSWVPQASSTGGAGMSSQLGDLRTVRTSSTVLTVGENYSTVTPCNVRFGTQTASLVQPATVTITAGTGTARIYIDSSGAVPALRVAADGVTLICNTQCSTTTGSAFPDASIPLYTWTSVAGVWDTSGGVDLRAFLSSTSINRGYGISLSQSAMSTTVSVDTATVPTYVTTLATLNFPTIPNIACSSDLTFAMPGAAMTDAVAPGWPATLENGLIGIMRVTAPGIIAVRICNYSGATMDPVQNSFRATIVRSF